MRVFIDSDYKCYVNDNGSLRAVDTDFFDGKCQRFIEGYRYVPAGESWTRPDGVVFAGEMIAPWRDYELLTEFQAQHEEQQAQIADMQAALDVIYTGVTE